MRVEVLCTGDELLNGSTADTNSPFFMEGLVRLGERVARTTVVGDDRAVIAEALRELTARADVVLVSGGLGPTADDLTVDAVADAVGVPVEEHQETLERLQERYALRGFELTPNNRRQARVPRGAEVIQNPVGSAPMMVVQIGQCAVFVVAGVPAEYRALVTGEVLPRLEELRLARGERSRFAVRLLKTIGLPESQLDARVAPIAAAHPDVVFGFRTVPPENHLKVTVRGATEEAAAQQLAAIEAECVAVLGPHLFGRDDQTLPTVVLGLLEGRGETIALAESLTGGWIARELTSVPGASNHLPGAAVTYQTRLKTDWLGVPAATIEAEGVVSAPVATAMAEGIRSHAGSSWGLATTGFAGPGGGDAREPVGAVYIGVAGPDGTTHERHQFAGDRERVRRFATFHALEALRRRLLAVEGRRT